MRLVILEVRSAAHPDHAVAKAWVDIADAAEAERRARDRIAADGYQAGTVIESTSTDESDYFPPCKSLDALLQARQDGVCVLYG